MENKYQEALKNLYDMRSKLIDVSSKNAQWVNNIEKYDFIGEQLATLQELVDKENCNIEEVGSWGYFGGCRHITDDVKFAYLRGEIELTNEQKFWFLGQLINKSKNKLSTSHNLICNMRGMGGTDKSVLKKILGVED